MEKRKYIIVPTNEVTSEMKNISKIEMFCRDKSETLLDFRYIESKFEKPSCFDDYDLLSIQELNEILHNKEGKWYIPIPGVDE